MSPHRSRIIALAVMLVGLSPAQAANNVLTLADQWWWVIPVAGFLGGGVTAWGIGFFVTHLVRHPVISVCLDKNKGCTGVAPLVRVEKKGDFYEVRHLYDVRYLRL